MNAYRVFNLGHGVRERERERRDEVGPLRCLLPCFVIASEVGFDGRYWKLAKSWGLGWMFG